MAKERRGHQLPINNLRVAQLGYTDDEIAMRNLFWNIDFIDKAGRSQTDDDGGYANRKHMYLRMFDNPVTTKKTPGVWQNLTARMKEMGADPHRVFFRLFRWCRETGIESLRPNQVISYCNRHENNWFLPSDLSVAKERLVVTANLQILIGTTRFYTGLGHKPEDATVTSIYENKSKPLITSIFAYAAGRPELVKSIFDQAVHYYITHQMEYDIIGEIGIPEEIKARAQEIRSLLLK